MLGYVLQSVKNWQGSLQENKKIYVFISVA